MTTHHVARDAVLQVEGIEHEIAAELILRRAIVAAAAVHAPIGVRTVLQEMTPLPNFFVNALSALFGIGLLIMGLDAVSILYQLGGG